MACLDFEWEHEPLLQIWKEVQDGNGDSTAMLETFTPVEAVSIFTQALSNNEACFICIYLFIFLWVASKLIMGHTITAKLWRSGYPSTI